MANKRKSFPKRKLNPIYFVFCEGETEESYAFFLRQKYRVPIIIKTKVTGQNISDRLIENYTREIRKGNYSKNDKNFLLYDYDSNEFIQRLKTIKNAILLVSNPCIELWFLLHFRNQIATITCNNCIRDLKGFITNYKKGELNNLLQDKLCQNRFEAIKRAKKLSEHENPSTTIYRLVEELEELKKQ